jgi:hypothetical protein
MTMPMKLQLLLKSTLVCIFLIIPVACSEAPTREPEKSAQPVAPPSPVTGRFAFQRMFMQAKGWAADAQPLNFSGIHLNQVPPEPGKCGAWQGTFISQQKAKARTYTYSVVDTGGIREGVLAGREEAWSGPRGQQQPFNPQALHVDSDEAYSAAVKESTDFIKKNPDLPVLFLLEQTPRFPNLAWRVIWGETLGSSRYSVFVDASTGRYLQTLR